MAYIDKEGIEWGFIIFKIKGCHYITGEVIKLKESLYKEILEPHIKWFEEKYPEYKIYIEE